MQLPIVLALLKLKVHEHQQMGFPRTGSTPASDTEIAFPVSKNRRVSMH
jgi:hypothetical protein